MKNIFAFTDTSQLPPNHQVGYVNLSEDEQGVAVLTVRSEGEAGHCASCDTQHPASAHLQVPLEELMKLRDAIDQYCGTKAFSELEPHEQRVMVERQQLQDRLNKLEAFIVSAVFSKLKVEGQFLMREQFSAMSRYIQILEARIRAFRKAEAPAA